MSRSHPPSITLPPPDLAAQPAKSFDAVPDLPATDAGNARIVRESSPYQAGDIVWVEFDTPDGRKVPRKAAIDHVGTRVTHHGDWALWYRVRFLSKDRVSWGKQWNRTYPGFIERGYALIAADVRPYGAEGNAND